METKRPISVGAEDLLGKYFPVLDYGFVGLVDYMGTDETIERSARVSYSGGGTRKVNQTRGLIRYLVNHQHSSPVEMGEFVLHMSMPIFAARQWIRHRTASLNEISGRYSVLPAVFYTPRQDQFQKQSKDNKQGRDGELDLEFYQTTVDKWNKLREYSVDLYHDLTENELARELARIDLPLSIYTQWYWKCDIRNILHLMSLRCDSHAQWEVRQYANVIAGMVKKAFPIIYESWIDYDFQARKFSRMERNVLSKLISAFIEKDDSLVLTTNEYSVVHPNDNFGLTKRELVEFMEKLEAPELIDFELDMTQAKDGEHFRRLLEEKT
jgi:thymidylate synthase (FAD)